MSLFDIDPIALMRQSVPAQLRKNRLMALIEVLAVPFVFLFNLFKARRAETLYRLAHNSQVCRMEAVLNDQFDHLFRRIRIVDAPEIDGLFLFRRDEQKPLFVYRKNEPAHAYMYRRQETSTDGGPGFIVKVPAAVAYDPALMRALINEYRLASKNNYKIITV
jgi:hypothetical protein